MELTTSDSAPVGAVIYDLDGVLVSTDEYHFRAWKRMADEEHIPFDRSNNERLRGVSRMESLAIILERSGRSYSAEERSELAERKNAYYVESLRSLGPEAVLPGARETVLALTEAGIKQAVASSSRNAKLILERTGLAGLFGATVDGTMISNSKPDPEVFLKAAAAIEEPANRCVVVEDAVAGIQAGTAAGMRCFAVGSAANELSAPQAAAGARVWKSAPSIENGALVNAVKPLADGSQR